MGSFNATCSLSDLTISCGDKCLLFPLVPAQFTSDKNGVIKIGPSSMYVSNEGAYMFFNPMCFPIFGEYNDYGSIENIEKNVNTEAIEKYFGITIEEFVSIITDGRKGMDDSYSDTFQVFAINKKILDKKFGPDFLTDLGFEIISKKDNTFFHPEAPKHIVQLIKSSGKEKGYPYQPYTYSFFNKEGQVTKKAIRDSYNSHKEFLNDFSDISGYILNVKTEDQEKAKFLLAASGMFILKDIYTFYAKERRTHFFGTEKTLSSDVVESMGFKLRCTDKTIERYSQVYEFPGVTDYVLNSDGTWSHIVKTSVEKPNTGKQEEWIYHPIDLVKTWKKLTNVDLPVTEKLLNVSQYDYNFDKLKKRMQAKEKSKIKELEQNKKFVKELEKTLSDSSKFEQSFKKFIESLSKEENKRVVDREDPFNFDDEGGENELSEMSKKMRAISKLIKDMNKENKTMLDPSVSLENKKSIYRKRLESNLNTQTEKTLTSIFNSFDSPLRDESLCMEFPLPRYSFQGFSFCESIYSALIANGEIKEDFVNFCHFYWGMRNNHRFFAPASYGSQEDNSSDRKVLAEKIIEISNERQKYYAEL